MHLASIDYAIIIGYFIVLVCIQNNFLKYFNFFSKANGLVDYFLAGRKLTLFPFIATIVSTWYGNLLGISEIAFKHGIVTWLSQGIFWYLIYFFFVFVLVKKIHQNQLLSIPDLLERVFNKKAAVAGAFINIVLMNSSVYILSLGILFELIFGLDRNIGIIIGALIPITYSIRGGFSALVLADIIQFFFMFIGVALMFPFLFTKYGGLNFLLEKVPQSHFEITGDWSWQLILAWFLIALWTTVDPNFYQITFAAKDSKTAQKGILISIIFWVIFDIMLNLLGLYAFAILPEADPKLALPLLASQTLPIILKGIFFTGLFATVVSTLDSLCFTGAMSFSYDVYSRITGDYKNSIKVNQYALIILSIIGVVIAMFFGSLMKIMYFRGTLAVSALFIPLISALLIPNKVKKNSAFYSIVAATVAAIITFIINQLNIFSLKIEPIFIGLLVNSITFFGFWFYDVNNAKTLAK